MLPDCGHFIFVEARDRFRDEVTQPPLWLE